MWRSLRTDSLQLALRRLPGALAEIEAEFEHQRQRAGMTVDATLMRPSENDLADGQSVALKAHSNPISSLPPTSYSISEVYKRYIDDPTHAWSSSTRQAYETTRTMALALLDGQQPISALSRAEIRGLIDVLRFLPKNSAKLFPKLSLTDAAKLARANPAINRISTANVNA